MSFVRAGSPGCATGRACKTSRATARRWQSTRRADMERRLLRLSSQLARTSLGAEAVVTHVKLGSRIAPGDAGWALLEQFREASTPEAAFERLGVVADERALYVQGIEQFVRAGVLVEPDEDA